jgi:hypothetical protein
MHGSLLPIPVGDDIGAFDMGMFYPPCRRRGQFEDMTADERSFD